MRKKIDITIDEKKAIAGFFTGEFSKEDSEVLNVWLDKSPENRVFFDELTDVWHSVNYLKYRDSFDAEKAWKDIQYRIKHNTKTHIKLPVYWLKIAAVFLLALTIGGIDLYYHYEKNESGSFPVLVEHIEPTGSHSFMKMPDGSGVWLNAGSRLGYDEAFGIKHREVTLSGEAFFEVKKDSALPFIVNAENFNIHVLGTSFWVISYPDDDRTQTYLESGKIELVLNESDAHFKMAPGEEAIFEKNSKNFTIEKTNLPKVASWRYGEISFYNKPFSDIAKTLERHFGIDMRFKNEALKDIRLTIDFENENIVEIIKYLEELAQVNIASYQNYYEIQTKND